jgi:hypothetical protein
VLSELGEETGARLLDRANVARWRLHIDPQRLSAEPNIGLARRHALSPIARDVERSLGRARGQTSEAGLRSLLTGLLRREDRRETETETETDTAAREQPAEA